MSIDNHRLGEGNMSQRTLIFLFHHDQIERNSEHHENSGFE
jgi:hypothetical protein